MITTQALNSVETLLSQMRAAAQAAQGGTASIGVSQPLSTQGGFAAELSRSLNRVSHAQNAANTQAKAFELGAPDISLSNVMIDLQKAGLAFQATVQVRNRLVEAYKEISSMAI